MIDDIEFVHFDVEGQLMDIVVGKLHRWISAVAFDDLQDGSVVVAVLGTELLLALVEDHFSEVEEVVSVGVVLNHFGGTLLASAQPVQTRLVIEVHEPLVLGACLALLVFVLLEELGTAWRERFNHPAGCEVDDSLFDLVVPENELFRHLD